MHEMVTFSMLIYQVDEYMERAIERDFENHLPMISEVITKLCRDLSATSDNNLPDGEAVEGPSHGLVNGESAALKEGVQQRLAYELEIFLNAHITQAIDNQKFAKQRKASTSTFHPTFSSQAQEYLNPGRTFYNWVRNTSADHTSCPFSFVFFSCLVPKLSSTVFKTARLAYLAEDLCRHLASLCRMYNDYGSIARDREENNLNSVNFPEFHLPIKGVRDTNQDTKIELMGIAEYEREGLERIMVALERELGDDSLMDALKVFIDVTDLYGQIYIQKDLTARNK
ncbi:hypothetical protein F5Y11DRAFT_361783 [Daldinia sp. FL1419]|nr:hypothetical protein F5Y11DRAFT_361783 [Daldinia sp. FL1419]